MPTIKLQILAEDIETAIYSSNDDCPIARALKRLGFNNVFVYPVGAIINHEKGNEHRIPIGDLDSRVSKMYLYKYGHGYEGEMPVDFEYELTYN